MSQLNKLENRQRENKRKEAEAHKKSKKKTKHLFVSMPVPDYPKFSKRIQREQKASKRGAYNFQKPSVYPVAEQWFQARKESRQPVIKIIEDCPLELKIPSYEDFEYQEL